MEKGGCCFKKVEGVMKEQKIQLSDQTGLNLYIFDDVKQPAKGVVQIVHGMQESMATYFEFAKILNENGYYAVGTDLRAHGKTAKTLDEIGTCHEDMFCNNVKDQIMLSLKIKKECSLPLYLFAHSYGSFLGQRIIQKTDIFDKVILSGSAYMKKPLISFGHIVASLFCAFGGAHKKAKLIEAMSFKNYQKQFKEGSWITSDEVKAKEFYDNKFNALPFENAFYKDMFKNQLKLYKKEDMKKIGNSPLFLISGELDPIGENTKSIKKLYNTYKNYNVNVDLKLYPECRHGLVQEKNREQVIRDILDFIKK